MWGLQTVMTGDTAIIFRQDFPIICVSYEGCMDNKIRFDEDYTSILLLSIQIC